MPVRPYVTALSLAVLLLVTAFAGPDDGAMIVVSAKAPRVTRFAAKELQTYLQKIAGRRLPIVNDDAKTQGRRFLVGAGRATDALGLSRRFGPEAFRIKTFGRDVALLGDDDDLRKAGPPFGFDYRTTRKGSLYAVYAFLERAFGVRWFWPGLEGEVVPKRADLSFPKIDVHEKPAFAWRHFWFLRNREVPEVTRRVLPLWYMRNRMGIAFGSPGSFAHSWTRYLDGNRSFKAHPKWYALVRGERRPFREEKGRALYSGSQVCTSNPEVVAQFLRKLRRRDPKRWDLVSISPNDGGGFCECAGCSALDHPELYGPHDGYNGVCLSDRIYTFANALARGIRKTHPKLNLGMFAYTFFNVPPKTIKRLEPNIVLSMTKINAFYTDPARKARDLERMKAWAKKHNKFIAREYLAVYGFMGVAHVQPRIIAEDIRTVQSLGYLGYYWEACADFAVNHLNAYVAARLLWDPEQDLDALLADYYVKAYGPAAPAMRAFFERMERAFEKRPVEHVSWATGHMPHWYDAKVLAEGERLLKAAEAKADTDAVRRRIAYVRVGFDYTHELFRFFWVCRKLNDAGLPVNLAGYRTRRLARPPTRAEVTALIREAVARLDGAEARLKEGHKTGGLDVMAYRLVADRSRWRSTLKEYAALYGSGDTEVVQLPLRWRFHLDPKNEGEKLGWTAADFDDAKWPMIGVDRFWEKQGYPKYDGVAWYRLSGVRAPKGAAWSKVKVRFGAVDESCWLFVNGKPAGEFLYDAKKDESSWKKPKTFDITPFFKMDGPNTFALKVRDVMGAGGVWKRVFLVFSGAPEKRTVLLDGFEEADAAWRKKVGLYEKGGEARLTKDAARDGKQGLRVVCRAPLPAHCSVTWRRVPVEPGKPYSLSAAYRIVRAEENAKARARWQRRPGLPSFRVIFCDERGKVCVPPKKYVWTHVPFQEKTKGWREVRKLFGTPPKARFVNLTVFFNAKGEYLLDDVRLERW